METWQYPAFSAVVHLALFERVQNAKALRARLISASTMPGAEGDAEREAVNFAFIDASLVASDLHLQTALLYALLADSRGPLRTKTIHSEILWALNPTNNISEAIRRFGVSDSSQRLIVLRVSTGGDSAAASAGPVEASMLAATEGTIVPLSRIPEFCDWAQLKKYYKLPAEASPQRLLDIITSTVATKAVA
ncbi:CGI-121-domain-containing protein [Auricularia subglabra TFB-10046 SS5]|uniref:EKC/KEOPS complex subunit CGI121 n=1 Tax=Auricularia subglabra (strain TFB-10046 / SS5) TaxID=717982 RepID=J0CXZ5_AURST|nr:CGI-121-domain-containing protein [Auricularia subglabra TFB-10046 SS5]